MKIYDWIVIGAGIVGSALAYELVVKGFKVLLLEKDPTLNNATRYSYGGLAYWSGITPVSKELCRESIELHRQLSVELDADTEFKETDLLLTIPFDADPRAIASQYCQFEISPELLTPQEAWEVEPLLNFTAISGVLKFPHGHIHPDKTTRAYQDAFVRKGGEFKLETAISFIDKNNFCEGIVTVKNRYYAANTVVCSGGLTRDFFQRAKIDLPVYFTQSQVIITPRVELELRAIVMPAIQGRFNLENWASNSSIWQGDQVVDSILDAGAVQFRDRTLCMGQVSAILPNPYLSLELAAGEKAIRQQIGKILPSLANLPGSPHNCLVAFPKNKIALIEAIKQFRGLWVFSGFTSTLLYAPILARHFAKAISSSEDYTNFDFERFISI
jgi:glycine/D-amino acid oxidase-like deaminating enzyme